MLDWRRTVPRDDSGEHLLHEIVDLMIVTHAPPEIAGKPAPYWLRLLGKRSVTGLVPPAFLHLTAVSHTLEATTNDWVADSAAPRAAKPIPWYRTELLEKPIQTGLQGDDRRSHRTKGSPAP